MRIAAIDVGTNSVHLIVCRIRPDLSFEVIDRERDMIRVGAGSLAEHCLPQANIDLAIQTLAKYRRLAESHGADRGARFGRVRASHPRWLLPLRAGGETRRARDAHLWPRRGARAAALSRAPAGGAAKHAPNRLELTW